MNTYVAAMNDTTWDGISPIQRINSLRLLFELTTDWLVSREIEAACHSIADSNSFYIDKISQIASNLHTHPELLKHGIDLVIMSNKTMASGTLIENIEYESQQRRIHFEDMLQEKYDLMNDVSVKSALKCRRCGSAEVSIEQKQTRGADEAMTIFCTCNKCQNRWKMS